MPFMINHSPGVMVNGADGDIEKRDDRNEDN